MPFRFACHRCGHCCTGGEGHVWLEPGEAERLAEGLGLTPEAFERSCVRQVPDPRTGELRPALREGLPGTPGAGRCVLLEGANHCRAYAGRPAQCARFPYWDSVLSDPEAFERARATCPGIAVEPPAERRAGALRELEALYAEVDAFVERARPVCILRGSCCRFEEAGHRLYATALEADYAAARHPEAPEPEAEGRCPYHVGGRCTAREGRPLGCRTYFCDARTRSVLEEATEHFLGRLRAIERAWDYPAAYALFPDLLRTRGIGPRAASQDPDPGPPAAHPSL